MNGLSDSGEGAVLAFQGLNLLGQHDRLITTLEGNHHDHLVSQQHRRIMAMRHSLSTDTCFSFDGLLVQIDLFNNEIEVLSRFSCKRNRAKNSILDRLQPFMSRIGAAWLSTGGAEDRQSTIGLVVFFNSSKDDIKDTGTDSSKP